jgi:hypothetical protein
MTQQGCGWMKDPSGFLGVRSLPAHAEEGELRTIFRVFLLASVLTVTALVPFLLAVHSSSSQAETAEAQAAPAATMLSWVANDDADKQTYVIDDYTLTLSTHVHSNGERVALLRVRAQTGESTSIHGQVGYRVPSARFGVGKLDARSSTQQVIFTSYTGGLHCCTQITVLELVEGKWRKVKLGLWDGDPLPQFPSDVDGDGTPDLVLKDDRFDYAFAPYTESHKPPRIFNIEGGKLIEVGHEARYDALYEADMRHAYTGCIKHKNAACAAFVANASRLGRRAWAWKIMLAHYRRSTDWNFPTKCKAKPVADVCPPGQAEQFREFPDALAWFLTDTGYSKP